MFTGRALAARARRSMVVALVMAVSAIGVFAPSAFASTPTVTTLDVPAGTQYGAFVVTAHVQPAPQPANGFIPAVGFLVGGSLSGAAPLDGNGDGSTELTLPPGTHEIVASFAGFDVWDASASAPASVVVGIGTTIELTSSLNPALNSQAVTISASVTPASGVLSGGTLSIVDSFDGATIASGTLGSTTSSVAVTRTFATGDHTLTATYSGDGDFGPAQAILVQTANLDDTVDATQIRVDFAKFYPVRDGYRDDNYIRGRLNEKASVRVRIYSPDGSLIKTVDLGLRNPGDYTVIWNGRNAAGTILPAGTYRIVQRLTDTVANVRSETFYVVLSHKKLSWTTSTVTLYGSQYSAKGHGGTGSISLSQPYYRGVRVASGSGWAAVRYSFTLHTGVVYSNLTFRVLGKSPNGRQAASGLWNPNYGSSLDAANYDGRLIGPAYDWWSLTLPSSNHRSGRSVHGEVLVENTGYGRKFDIAKVKLVYRWAVLV